MRGHECAELIAAEQSFGGQGSDELGLQDHDSEAGRTAQPRPLEKPSLYHKRGRIGSLRSPPFCYCCLLLLVLEVVPRGFEFSPELADPSRADTELRGQVHRAMVHGHVRDEPLFPITETEEPGREVETEGHLIGHG